MKQEITITENRAPTDDSIRLYHELVEKAYSEVVHRLTGSIKLGDINAFKVVTFQDHLAFSYKIYVKLPGKVEPLKMEISGLHSEDEIKEIIIDRLSKALAIHLIQHADFR